MSNSKSNSADVATDQESKQLKEVRQRYLVAQVKVRREYLAELAQIGELPKQEQSIKQKILDSEEHLFWMRFPCGNEINIYLNGKVTFSGGEEGFLVKDYKEGFFINNFAASFMCEPSQRALQDACSDLGELQSWMAK